MTTEQKKAIDACKDQAAKEQSYEGQEFKDWYELKALGSGYLREEAIDRAMQLYGEQCRKEGPIKPEPIQGPVMDCHRCGEPCNGTYAGEPTCFDCARGLSDD